VPEIKKLNKKDLISVRDVLPDIEKIMEHSLREKKRLWGKRYVNALIKPETIEDRLFAALAALEETTLRLECTVIAPERAQADIHNTRIEDKTTGEFVDWQTYYVDRMLGQIANVLGRLREIGKFDRYIAAFIATLTDKR
jgi:hypothetical protein